MVSEYILCTKCNGAGLMETPIIICSNCQGKTCYKCLNQSGLIQYPYSECDKCFGSGRIFSCNKDKKLTNIPNKEKKTDI